MSIHRLSMRIFKNFCEQHKTYTHHIMHEFVRLCVQIGTQSVHSLRTVLTTQIVNVYEVARIIMCKNADEGRWRAADRVVGRTGQPSNESDHIEKPPQNIHSTTRACAHGTAPQHNRTTKTCHFINKHNVYMRYMCISCTVSHTIIYIHHHVRLHTCWYECGKKSVRQVFKWWVAVCCGRSCNVSHNITRINRAHHQHRCSSGQWPRLINTHTHTWQNDRVTNNE